MKALFVTTVDTFFLSHWQPIACALRDEGFTVVVAAAPSAPGEAADRIRALGMRFVPLALDRGSVSPSREARAWAQIFQLYRDERPELVHQTSIKPMIYGSIAAHLLRLPHVLNTVSGLGYALTATPHPSLERRLLRWTALSGYRVALRSSRCRNIFENRDQRRAFIAAGLSSEEQSALVLGAGVDTDRFRPTPLPAGDPLVVLPARMLRDKGVGELVAAARLVRARAAGRAEGRTVRFALVGGADPGNRAGIPRAELEAWVHEGVVEWWGNQSDMAAVFARSHLVVLPSYAEGMPLVLAEAAASGRACVTSDVPGCREAVIDGESGLLVPVRDPEALAAAIERLVYDRAELERMGSRARAHAVSVLSRERILPQMLAIIRDMGVRWPTAP